MLGRKIRPLGAPRSRSARSRSPPGTSSGMIARFSRQAQRGHQEQSRNEFPGEEAEENIGGKQRRQAHNNPLPANHPNEPVSSDASQRASALTLEESPEPQSVTNIVVFAPDEEGFYESDWFGKLPNFNPFWAEELKKGGGHERIRNDRHDAANNPNPDRPIPPLTLFAGERLDEELQHDDDAVRVFAQRVFFRCLRLSSEDIAHTIIQSRMRRNTNIHSMWRGRIMDWQKQFQNGLLSFILAGVRELVQTTGGLEMWLGASRRQRREVFLAYYQQDPKYTSMLFFKPVVAGVDFHGIFASNDPPRDNWQTFVKNIFIWTCEDTFDLRIKTLDTQAMISTMVSNFRQMAFDKPFKDLNLGDVDKVPIHVLGAVDQQRRAKIRPLLVPGGARELVAD